MYSLSNMLFIIKIIMFNILLYLYIPKFIYIYIFYSVYLIIENMLIILYNKIFYKNLNIFFPSSPLKSENLCMTYAIIDVFIIAPRQRAFLINYYIFSDNKLIVDWWNTVLTFFSIIIFIVVLSFFNLYYVQYVLLVLFINNIKLGKNETYWYGKIKYRFTFDHLIHNYCIRIFNGRVKVNGKNIEDEIAEYIDNTSPRWVENTIDGIKNRKHLNFKFSDDGNIDATYSHNIPNKSPFKSDTLYGDSKTKIFLTNNKMSINIPTDINDEVKESIFYDHLQMFNNEKLLNLNSTDILINNHKNVKLIEIDVESIIDDFLKSKRCELMKDVYKYKLLNDRTFLKKTLDSSKLPLTQKIFIKLLEQFKK